MLPGLFVPFSQMQKVQTLSLVFLAESTLASPLGAANVISGSPPTSHSPAESASAPPPGGADEVSGKPIPSL